MTLPTIPQVDAALSSLQQITASLDELMVPLGFHFQHEANDLGHQAYATGFYIRGPFRIGLIWRGHTGLGNIDYCFTEETQTGYLRERKTWHMSHKGFMRATGSELEQKWVEPSGLSGEARSTGDVVSAIYSDWSLALANLTFDESVRIFKQFGYGTREVL